MTSNYRSRPCTNLESSAAPTTQRVHAHHVAAPHSASSEPMVDGLRRLSPHSIEPLRSTPHGGLVDQRHHLVLAQALARSREGLFASSEFVSAQNVALSCSLREKFLIRLIAGSTVVLFNCSDTRRARLLSRAMTLPEFCHRVRSPIESRYCRRRRCPPRRAGALPRRISHDHAISIARGKRKNTSFGSFRPRYRPRGLTLLPAVNGRRTRRPPWGRNVPRAGAQRHGPPGGRTAARECRQAYSASATCHAPAHAPGCGSNARRNRDSCSG